MNFAARAVSAAASLLLLSSICHAQDKKTGPPAFKSAWKVDLPAGTRRIAVADVAGDKPRLLALGDGATLGIYVVKNDAATKEASIELGEKPEQFVVGRFAKNKPAVIAAPGLVYYRDGDKYTKKAAAEVKDITGVARFSDGEECFFFFDGNGAPQSWAIDTAAANPLVNGHDMPPPDQGAGIYRSVVAHLPGAVIAGLGFPEEAQKLGLVGLYDPREDGKLYAWLPMPTADNPALVLFEVSQLMPGGAPPKPVWKSSKLAGTPLDAVTGADPKGTKQVGIFVLVSTGTDGKGRAVEFFALD